jgi:hypothetical protein
VIERVEADLRAARLARDPVRVTALSTLLSALRGAAKEAGGELGEAGAVAVLRRERKRLEEAAASFREGDREDQARASEAEARLVEGYLPQELDAAELASIVDAAIAETGASSPRAMGAVMKLVMARTAGRADGKTVSALVRERLAG